MTYICASVRRQSLGVGLLALLLLMAGVYQQAPIGFDSRFVLFAQEMLRHGPTVFPTTYGEPYADYSAVSTLFTETIQALESLGGPAWLMMDQSDYKALQGTPPGNLQPVLSGRFDKNDFVLLHKQAQ